MRRYDVPSLYIIPVIAVPCHMPFRESDDELSFWASIQYSVHILVRTGYARTTCILICADVIEIWKFRREKSWLMAGSLPISQSKRTRTIRRSPWRLLVDR
eukprot:scaffold36208_cov49-Attheya_sp.AAC.2